MGVRSLCETSAVKRRSRVIDITVRGYPQPMKVMEWVWPITGLFDAAQLGAQREGHLRGVAGCGEPVLPDAAGWAAVTLKA